MDSSPPPYTPQQHPSPTAPPVEQVAAGPEFGMPSYQSHPSVTPSPTGSQQFQQNAASFHHSSSSNQISQQAYPLYPALPLQSPTVAQNASRAPQVAPLRCMAGTVEITTGDSSIVEKLGPWKSQFLEVRDGVLYMATSGLKRSEAATKPLQNNYISMPGKRLVAIEDNWSCVVIKAPNEARAHQWFMALSQYCFAAPTMAGYCQKLSNRKKVFELRFLRLSSDGVLSWFRTDSEDSERRGSIQVRGQVCELDKLNANQVNIQVTQRTYQFHFSSSREAQLWLAALQWHYGRKSLKKAAVPLRNKAR